MEFSTWRRQMRIHVLLWQILLWVVDVTFRKNSIYSYNKSTRFEPIGSSGPAFSASSTALWPAAFLVQCTTDETLELINKYSKSNSYAWLTDDLRLGVVFWTGLSRSPPEFWPLIGVRGIIINEWVATFKRWTRSGSKCIKTITTVEGRAISINRFIPGRRRWFMERRIELHVQ